MARAPRTPSTRVYSPDERRRILLENRFFASVDELCAKWSLRKTELRAWKRELDWDRTYPDLRETLIAALYPQRSGATLDSLREFVDHIQHVRLTDAELLPLLRELESQGIARPDGEQWCYVHDHLASTGFIF